MKILVLGSAGQVGKHLCSHLSSLGHEVIECDIVNGSHQDLRTINAYIDLRMRAADFVFFLAFDVGGSRYLSKYQHTYDFLDNNIKIMNNTFKLLKQYNKPFVFASSQMSNMSYSPYGVAKAVGECYTKALDGLTVKFWNVYGVEHDPEKSHVITDFINKAKNTGVIDMMTDGTEEREFLYADDCCEALVAVMNNYKDVPRDEELSITSFFSSTILEVANIIASKIPAKIVPSDKKDSVQMNKKNIPSKYILNYWNPKTSLEDGIGEIIKHMENE